MPNDPIEQIRSQVDIVDLIGDYVKLTKAGKNYKGCCPFHQEKTPSFNVSQPLQRFHCFGCGEGGDIFTFLQKIENLSFNEALKRLAERAGIEIAERKGDGKSGQSEKEEWFKAINAAQNYFREQLTKASFAREYLSKRLIDSAIAERYGIGYAPDSWDGLSNHLQKNGISLVKAKVVGLTDEGQNGFYDKFRNRIMIPIRDGQGRIIAYGGRAMGDGEPKYLNSPETPLFVKRNTLYGLDQVRLKILKSRHAVLVEGYFDVIALQINGFDEALASLGTAFGDEHAKNLKRWVDSVTICYDADNAGISASIKAGEALEQNGFQVRVAAMTPGEDPDTMIQKYGRAKMSEVLSNALPITEFQINRIIRESKLDEPNAVVEMFRKIYPVISHVESAVERDRYIQMIARYAPAYRSNPTQTEASIREDIQRTRKELGSYKSKTKEGKSTPAANIESKVKPYPKALIEAEMTLLRAAFELEWREQVWDWIVVDKFFNEDHRNIVSSMRSVWLDNFPIESAEAMLQKLDEASNKSVIAMLIQETKPLTFEWIRDSMNYINQYHLRRKASEARDKLIIEGDMDTEKLFERLIIEAQSIKKQD